jgi:hypothetical protein
MNLAQVRLTVVRTPRRGNRRGWLIPAAGFLGLVVTSCAGAVIDKAASPSGPRRDALLVLPGFGYSGEGEKALRALARSMAADGVELFVPTYVSRGGLSDSRNNLHQFIRDHQLDRYERLHVFAFIAGAWTFNPLAAADRPANLTTVVYDRSPYQERAPKIADEDVHFLTRLRYGSPVFDLARTPYPPFEASGVKVGLVVETLPTDFIRKHAQAARRQGPFQFDCVSFGQRYDDCLYVAMNHDELYVRFAEVWPDLRTFMRSGRFTAAANRTPPSGDPLAATRR